MNCNSSNLEAKCLGKASENIASVMEVRGKSVFLKRNLQLPFPHPYLVLINHKKPVKKGNEIMNLII